MTSITSSSCHSPVFISNYGFPPFKASLHLTILLLLLFCELNFEVQYPSHACTFITSSSLKEWSHEPTTCGVQLSTKHWAFLSCRILLKRKRKRKKIKEENGRKKVSLNISLFPLKVCKRGVFGRINHNMEKLRSTCWMDSAKSWYSLFVFQCFDSFLHFLGLPGST